MYRLFLAAIFLAVVASVTQAETITSFSVDKLTWSGLLTSDVGTAFVNNGVVEKTYSKVADIYMKVEDVEAGDYSISEIITNSTAREWSDFQWELLVFDGNDWVVDNGDSLKFTSISSTAPFTATTGENTDLVKVFDQGGALLGGNQSISVDYVISVPTEMTFVVRQFDSAPVEVPAPGVGIALAGLSMMLGFGRIVRRQA